jgi:hypothetical protein
MAAIAAAPESRVLAHPIKIAAGNWTAVTGILPGNITMVYSCTLGERQNI